VKAQKKLGQHAYEATTSKKRAELGRAFLLSHCISARQKLAWWRCGHACSAPHRANR